VKKEILIYGGTAILLVGFAYYMSKSFQDLIAKALNGFGNIYIPGEETAGNAVSVAAEDISFVVSGGTAKGYSDYLYLQQQKAISNDPRGNMLLLEGTAQH
jgi:hypothetical protein